MVPKIVWLLCYLFIEMADHSLPVEVSKGNASPQTQSLPWQLLLCHVVELDIVVLYLLLTLTQSLCVISCNQPHFYEVCIIPMSDIVY